MKADFEKFTQFFPVIELPITLNEETMHSFDTTNDVLPQPFISRYIEPYHEDVDEFTEFIPCFKVPDTKNFHALVYWKAQLMEYEYYMITFSDKAEFIDNCLLSSTTLLEDKILQSVATIEADWQINVMAGELSTDPLALYDASTSKEISFELCEDGTISAI
ncbi:MAG: hypothetical protein KA010_01570 [Saprospiraceae bacterium]|nr:hypothetical protein [Saprospiraceae bacterium]